MQQYQLSNSHSFFLLSQQQLAGQCSRLSLPVHRHVYQMPFVEVKQAILVAVIVTRRLGEYASLVPFVQLMEQQPSLNVQLQLLWLISSEYFQQLSLVLELLLLTAQPQAF